MAHANNMTTLINEIELKCGLKPLTPHLPDEYNKDAWASWIEDFTLREFSRYFGWKVPFPVTPDVPVKDGWYIIDEEKYFGKDNVLLGVQDIDWQDMSRYNSSITQAVGYGGNVDVYAMNYSLDDIMLTQGRADCMSLFDRGLYIKYREPNMFRIEGPLGQPSIRLRRFMVTVLLVHPTSLTTISPTKMGTFRDLAMADVCTVLAANLKYWDQYETVFSQIDLKLGDIENIASTRSNIIDELKSSYVTAANESIPMIITI